MSELDPISVTFLVDGNEMTPVGFHLDEALNRPYKLLVRITTEDLSFEPGSLLGLTATLTITRGEVARDVHGVVVRIEEGARPDNVSQAFDLTVMPALMALSLRKTSRIFQEKKVNEILQEVLDEGLEPYSRSATVVEPEGTVPIEYAVQYRETDLAFTERLMEEHGIGYWFDHSGQEEVLTLFHDDGDFPYLVSHGNDQGLLPVSPREDASSAVNECMVRFRMLSERRPTVARTRVFSWLSPTELTPDDNDTPSEPASFSRPVDGAAGVSEREMYEHEEPSTRYGYETTYEFDQVQKQTQYRRELQRRDALRGVGTSNAIQIAPAVRFEMTGHPQVDLDGEFYVTRAVHRWGTSSDFGDTDNDGRRTQRPSWVGLEYENWFEVLPVGVVWRPQRRRPKPRIHGIQTAIVTGPSGEEIHTDEHGRIKCQFHWDRDGQNDEASSCFVRVMQPWAGQNWGTFFLPRIGMEVVVSFVDGDPDRPVVTGCLYNAANPPPYALPDDKTKSTIMTSSHMGEGFNELRFEDSSGSEEVFLHAQKDFNEVVLNNHTTNVRNNQTNEIGKDQTEKVGQHQTMEVTGNREVTVGGNFDETISGTETRIVTGAVTETLGGDESRTLGGAQTEVIATNLTQTVTGSATQIVAGAAVQTVAAGITTTSGGAQSFTAGGGFTMTTPAAFNVTATGGFNLTAPGGVNVVDASYWSITPAAGSIHGQQTGIVGQQTGIAGNKVDVAGLAMAAVGFNLAANGTNLSAAGVQGSKVGVDLDSGGLSTKQKALNAITCGLYSLF